MSRGFRGELPRPPCSLCSSSGYLFYLDGIPRGTPAASLKHLVKGLLGQRQEGIPRGTPAASLKPGANTGTTKHRGRIPRGTPAASLKRYLLNFFRCEILGDSAGNSRGLIEADSPYSGCKGKSAGIPRGTPAASLKPRRSDARADGRARGFRGELPRPH